MIEKKGIIELYKLSENNETICHALHCLNEDLEKSISELNQQLRSELAIVKGSSKIIEQKNPSLMEQPEWTHLKQNFLNLLDYLNGYEQLRAQFDHHYSYVDVIDLCEKICYTFRQTAMAGHVTLTFHNEIQNEAAFRHYFCDRQHLQDAIMGLLKHAFHYIANVSYVSITLRDDIENGCILHVQRDGDSIPQEELQAIRDGHFSRKLFRKHEGILICQQFAFRNHQELLVYSDSERTFVTMKLTN